MEAAMQHVVLDAGERCADKGDVLELILNALVERWVGPCECE
jgi:hypothetical protein